MPEGGSLRLVHRIHIFTGAKEHRDQSRIAVEHGTVQWRVPVHARRLDFRAVSEKPPNTRSIFRLGGMVKDRPIIIRR
jgi:hypothetical protein